MIKARGFNALLVNTILWQPVVHVHSQMDASASIKLGA